jgi:gamma-glutamyltranspeptidase/glutathione hydrolase
LARLPEDAIELARGGVAVSASQANNTRAKLAELADSLGFRDTFVPGGASPEPGARFTQPRVADTLHRLGGASWSTAPWGAKASPRPRPLCSPGT